MGDEIASRPELDNTAVRVAWERYDGERLEEESSTFRHAALTLREAARGKRAVTKKREEQCAHTHHTRTGERARTGDVTWHGVQSGTSAMAAYGPGRFWSREEETEKEK